jgi:hypothetical protein
MVNSAQLDNALVAQKNHLLELINEGYYGEAIQLLMFVKELWDAVGYRYKTVELKERIKQAIDIKLQESTHYKTVAMWNSLLVELNNVS